jgi:hypothetical protein
LGGAKIASYAAAGRESRQRFIAVKTTAHIPMAIYSYAGKDRHALPAGLRATVHDRSL